MLLLLYVAKKSLHFIHLLTYLTPQIQPLADTVHYKYALTYLLKVTVTRLTFIKHTGKVETSLTDERSEPGNELSRFAIGGRCCLYCSLRQREELMLTRSTVGDG